MTKGNKAITDSMLSEHSCASMSLMCGDFLRGNADNNINKIIFNKQTTAPAHTKRGKYGHIAGTRRAWRDYRAHLLTQEPNFWVEGSFGHEKVLIDIFDVFFM